MSACISGEGEYSEHVTAGNRYICERCGVFDEEGVTDVLAKVLALCEPFLGQEDGYQHYAISLTDGVHLAVLLDDLRAALGVEL